MRFIWHEALWLLLTVPILIGIHEVLLRRVATRDALRFTELGLAQASVSANQWLRRRIPPLLFLLGIAALLLAVARPVAVFLVSAQRGTVVLTLDVSISMAATDVPPTRLAAAQAAAAQFVEKMPAGIRIGIVAFGGYADPVLAPTTEKRRVLSALNRLHLQNFTSLGSGLLAALQMIRPDVALDPKYDLYSRMENVPQPQTGWMRSPPPRRNQPKTDLSPAPIDPSTLIILVSDGHGTLGVPASIASELIASFGIRVCTVGVGTAYGGTAKIEGQAPVHAEFEEETLRLIASITRGDYFHASTLSNITSIYDGLTQGVVQERKEIEISALLAALGGVLLVLGGGFSLAWHGRSG